jgi:hypothetical protein
VQEIPEFGANRFKLIGNKKKEGEINGNQRESGKWTVVNGIQRESEKCTVVNGNRWESDEIRGNSE